MPRAEIPGVHSRDLIGAAWEIRALAHYVSKTSPEAAGSIRSLVPIRVIACVDAWTASGVAPWQHRSIGLANAAQLIVKLSASEPARSPLGGCRPLPGTGVDVHGLAGCVL